MNTQIAFGSDVKYKDSLVAVSQTKLQHYPQPQKVSVKIVFVLKLICLKDVSAASKKELL